MFKVNKRIKREQKTIKVMVYWYCNKNHGTLEGELCTECQSILNYALDRIDNCPFLPDKPTCKNCPVHCYKNQEKQKIKEIMRFSGPRMLKTYPLLTIFHLIDGINDKKRISKIKTTPKRSSDTLQKYL